MSNAIYEKIGRRVVEIYAAQDAEFAKRPPNKGQDGKKPKCKDTSHSCGFTCISGKKTCRITMTMEQQAAAKALKKELRATKKADGPASDASSAKPAAPKAKQEPATKAKSVAKKTPLEQIQEAHPSLKPMEAELKAKQLGRLDDRLESATGTDGDKAYRAALLAKEDPDSSEAALDRIQSLYAARNEVEKKQELSADRLQNVPSDLIQGWRGGSVGEINRAAAEYTAEIWAALPPAQRNKFIDHHLERSDKTFTEHLQRRPGFAEISKSKAVAKFLAEADRAVRVANGEED
jgi:hypothetical protein